MANGEYGEPGRPGERGEHGGGYGGSGGFGGAGGRGAGYRSNGNGNGGGKQQTTVTTWAPMVIMVLGLFGFWWASADPRERLNKIETSQFENRKELNEALTSLRREAVSNYTTLREHNDLQSRINNQIDDIQKTEALNHGQSLTKAQFDAWKLERDKYLDSIIKRIDFIRDELLIIVKASSEADSSKLETLVKTNEKSHDQVSLRMDRLQILLDRTYEKLMTDLRAFSERVDRQDTPLGKRVDGMDLRLTALTDRLNNKK